MAYSNKIKEEAFGLYCEKPVFDYVAREMQRLHPKDCGQLTRHTVRTWAEKYNWDSRREVIIRRTQEKIDAKRISNRAELIVQLEELEQQLIQDAMNIRAKSKEGAVNAAISLSNHILELRGEKGKRKGIDGNELESVLAIIFDVLQRHPKIGQYIIEEQDFIIKQIERELEDV